ncbi:MAG: hypothetical protein ACRDR6_03320 [Pseudonocardiaceae bacterium]
MLAYLVDLTKPVPAADQAAMSVPGWWTSDAPSGQPPGAFLDGHADLGMAHGISGPLALLSLAMRHGIIVDGQVAAIDDLRGTAPHTAPPPRATTEPTPAPKTPQTPLDNTEKRHAPCSTPGLDRQPCLADPAAGVARRIWTYGRSPRLRTGNRSAPTGPQGARPIGCIGT